ncbi:hypothetical protein [Brucella intermedia]|uniref:hypothetical protein n=1 Tax=Brucella intermedia TaxID=94625 RepID=UPI00224B2281|nr:hypothetical protein [Brucella intermedia]
MMVPIRINPPDNAPVGSAHYQQDCIFALEPSVFGLVELAKEAGWDEQQVFFALMCLAVMNIKDEEMLGEFTYQ